MIDPRRLLPHRAPSRSGCPRGAAPFLAVLAMIFPMSALAGEFLVGFGSNHVGQIDIPDGLGEIHAFDAGYHHAVAAGPDGIAAWGENEMGQANVPAGIPSVVEVSVGFRHNLAVSVHGTVFGWGYNSHGQATVPAALTNAVSVSAGGFHSLALTGDGRILAWGQDLHGQTDVPSVAGRPAAIAAGGYHSVLLTDQGRVVAWGYNGQGQLDVPAGLADAVAVDAGFYHTLAVRSNGTVAAWGWDGYYQTRVPPGLTNVTAVAAGYSHSVALRADGRVVSWGGHRAGRPIGPDDAANVTAIAAGAHFTLLRTRGPVIVRQPEDVVFQPGEDLYLSAGVLADRPLWYQWERKGAEIPGATNAVLAIPAASVADCGAYRVRIGAGEDVVSSRTVSVGTPPVILEQPQPVHVYRGNSTAIWVSASSATEPTYHWYHYGVLRSSADSNRYLVENAEYGDSGEYWVVVSNDAGSVTSATARVFIRARPTMHISTLGSPHAAYGGELTLQIQQTGVGVDRYQWQLNGQDIPGADSLTLLLSDLRPSHAGRYRYASITEAGALYSDEVAITVDRANPVHFAGRDVALEVGDGFGSVTAWQWFRDGEAVAGADGPTLRFESLMGEHAGRYTVRLTDGEGEREVAAAWLAVLPEPVPGSLYAWGSAQPELPGFADAVAVAAGSVHGLVLRADGSVSGYGDDRCQATAVPASIAECVAVAAGEYNSMVLRTDGRVVFLGDCSCPPCAGPPIERAVAISMGALHAVAVLNDGTVGFAGSGPPPPPGLSNVVAVAAGYSHSLALDRLGTVTAWGDNTAGQLDVPPGLGAATAIAAGDYHNVAILDGGEIAAWGDNSFGQCDVPAGLADAVAVRAGPRHSLAILADGTVVAWGDGQDGGPGEWPYPARAVDAAGGATFNAVVAGSASLPAILRHPHSITNDAGAGTAFTVRARSSAPLSYQWRFGTVDLPGATNSTLTLTDLTPDREGFYSAVVSTPEGEVISRPAFLSVNPAPFLPYPSGIAGRVVTWGVGEVVSELPQVELTNVVAIAAGAQAQNAYAFGADGSLTRWGSRGGMPPGVSNVVAVSVGNGMDVWLRDNGTLTVWNPPNAVSSLPDIRGVRAVSAGITYLALFTDGTVRNLGNPSWNLLDGATDAVAISLGSRHALALRNDGTVVQDISKPLSGATPVPSGLSNVVAVAAGSHHSLALRADGTVEAWGSNLEGQCAVPPGLSNVVAIAAGGSHSLALRSDGTVVPWGDYYYGLNQQPDGLTNVVAIACGLRNNIVIQAGPVFTLRPSDLVVPAGTEVVLQSFAEAIGPVRYQWYLDGVPIAQGTNAALNISSARPEDAGLYRVQAEADGYEAHMTARLALSGAPAIVRPPEHQWVVAGEQAIFSVETDASAPVRYQWFFDDAALPGETNSALAVDATPAHAGQYRVRLGYPHGPQTNLVAELSVIRDVPMGTVLSWGSRTDVPESLSGVIAVAAGNDFSIALRADGTVIAWGDNTNSRTNVPAGVRHALAIAAGDYHGLTLTREGTVLGWGHNHNGQAVSQGLIGCRAIAAGNSFSAAVAGDGTLLAWGNPYDGALDVPGAVSDAVAVAAGFSHAIALRANGEVVGWGNDSHGQATPPPGLTNAIAVAAGHYNSIALLGDRSVRVFGMNYYDQLNVPPALPAAASIAAAYGRYLIATTDGQVIGWGNNNEGQSAAPPGLSNVVQVAAGNTHSLALVETGCFVVEPPRDTVALAGTVVTMRVDVRAATPLRYQWLHDGADIPGATDRILTVPGARLSDAGEYTVQIRSERGEESHRATLVVHSPPVLTASPFDQTVLEGTEAILAVEVEGTPPVLLQWQRDGEDIPGATNAALRVPSALAADAGDYRVVAVNQYGQATSTTATLKVNLPPWFESAPQDTVAVVGTDAVLAAVVGGTAPVHLEWYKDGWPVDGATNAVLRIESVQPVHQGAYRLLARNPFGSAYSPAAALTVAPLEPTIVAAPADRGVLLGTHEFIRVDAAGSGPLTYRWTHNGTNLAAGTSAQLDLPGFHYGHRGVYQVEVSNAYGSVRSEPATLTLRLPPNVAAWGSNLFHQIEVPADLTNAVAIAAGEYHSLALRDDGTVVAWGDPTHGASDVPEDLGPVMAIAAGGIHSLALREDGTVAAWGAATSPYGEASPPEGLSDVVALEASTNVSMAVHSDGTVSVWGAWDFLPAIVTPTNVAAVAAGVQHAVALRADGTVTRWRAYAGDLVGLSNVTAIACSEHTSLAMLDDGRVMSWGLGFGVDVTQVGPTNAVAVDGGGASVTLRLGLATYHFYPHFLAAQSDGQVTVWGHNPEGLFTPPAGLAGVTDVAAGGWHNLALIRAPLVIQPLSDQTVAEGEDAVFAVVASRAEEASIQWFHNGAEVEGATQWVLLLPHVRYADRGEYSASINSPFGRTDTLPASLTVIPAEPRILDDPQSVNALEGEDAVFRVSAVGVEPLTIQWMFNGLAVPGATGSTLTVTGVSAGRCGQYQAAVANPNGAALSEPATLTLWAGELIVDNPQASAAGAWMAADVPLQFGSDSLAKTGGFGDAYVRFAVQVPRAGDYRVEHWLPDQAGRSGGVPYLIHHADGSTLLAVDQTGPAGQWVAVGIFPFAPAQPGQVVIFDGIADPERIAVADAFRFTFVAGPPRWLSPPHHQTVLLGRPLELIADIGGSGPFLFQWFQNGELLPGATGKHYAVDATSPGDAGTYSVLVAGPDGTVLGPVAEVRAAVSPIALRGYRADLVLTWEGPGDLQEAGEVNGPYVDVPGAITPHTNAAPTDVQRFYRLRYP